MKRGSHNRTYGVDTDLPVIPIYGYTDTESLKSLLQAIKPCSDKTRKLFVKLVSTPPAVRTVNAFNTALSILLHHKYTTDGLSEFERVALAELHTCNLPVDMLGTAHALLCTDDRHALISGWSAYISELKTKKNDYLQDNIEELLN